jgi:hypothetical protein
MRLRCRCYVELHKLLFIGIGTKNGALTLRPQRLLTAGYVEVAGQIPATEKETCDCDEINTLNSESQEARVRYELVEAEGGQTFEYGA